ncbi:MAG: hypothetical protein ACQEUT_18200 [Bacillota bacterium]
MAFFPMKQVITVKKSTAVSDGWGKKLVEEIEIPMKCRADEVAETIENMEGKETVVSLKVFLDKLPDIGYEDTITYTNELGVTTSKKPEKIQPARDFGGKVIHTVVYL